MNVGELIIKPKNFPLDMPVVLNEFDDCDVMSAYVSEIPSYENDFVRIKVVKISANGGRNE